MVAVVTGSSRGIGRAIAGQLEQDGFTVVYSSASGNAGNAPHCIQCDISNSEDRQRLCDETLRKFGRVDCLVNNAGVAPLERTDLLQTSEESFRRVLGVNLEGTFFLSQLFARAMVQLSETLEDYAPRIVNISSISAYTSSIERGEYCISKAGVAMVTQLFAHRLAEHGIGVFEVRPGVIATDMTAPVTAKYEALIENGLTPTRRMGAPQDVAACVAAICRGDFDFSTGQVFNVDGGFHIRRL